MLKKNYYISHVIVYANDSFSNFVAKKNLRSIDK